MDALQLEQLNLIMFDQMEQIQPNWYYISDKQSAIVLLISLKHKQKINKMH